MLPGPSLTSLAMSLTKCCTPLPGGNIVIEHCGGGLVCCSIEWLAGGGQGNQNHCVYVSNGEAGLSVISLSMYLVIVVLYMQEVCQNILSKVE